MKRAAVSTIVCLLAFAAGAAQSPREPDWTAVQTETMRHFQALLRLDTSNPPGNERRAAEYLKQVFDREGIPARILAVDPARPTSSPASRATAASVRS